MNKFQGFTLIELMIVVAILAILSTLAMPSFQDRIIKTQVNEGVVMTEFVRQSVGVFYAKTKIMPENNAAAGLPPSDKILGNYVTGVEVKKGVVNITFGARSNSNLSGKTLSIRPAVVEGYASVPIAWVCGKAEAPQKMNVFGSDATTIPAPHLPLDCLR